MNNAQHRIQSILNSTGFDIGNKTSDGEAYEERIKPVLMYKLLEEFKDVRKKT